MRHLKLEKPALHILEASFVVDAQDDGMRPSRKSSWGALSGSVYELRSENSARKITSNDAEVR